MLISVNFYDESVEIISDTRLQLNLNFQLIYGNQVNAVGATNSSLVHFEWHHIGARDKWPLPQPPSASPHSSSIPVLVYFRPFLHFALLPKNHQIGSWKSRPPLHCSLIKSFPLQRLWIRRRRFLRSRQTASNAPGNGLIISEWMDAELDWAGWTSFSQLASQALIRGARLVALKRRSQVKPLELLSITQLNSTKFAFWLIWP